MIDPKKIVEATGLTFDDVLIIPNYTDIKRDSIDVSTTLTTKIKLSLPLLSSPMDTVTTAHMAIAIGKLGGLGVIHRNLTIEKQADEVKKVKEEHLLSAAAVGIGNDMKDRVSALVSAGVDVLVVDSAHGFSCWVIETTKYISHNYPDIALVSGSVATAAGAKALIDAGASCLRIGMGPGSICTTRIVAGMGVPQITAILDTAAVARAYNIPVMADGGLRYSGDIVKALAAGASTVMSGSLFAGCDEAPGKKISVKGKIYKSYRGMGSVSAMKQGSAARYGQEYRKGHEKKLIAEGVEGMVTYKGKLADVITQLVGGLKTGMYYAGAKNIEELQTKTRFMRITQASLTESFPHDVVMEEVSREKKVPRVSKGK